MSQLINFKCNVIDILTEYSHMNSSGNYKWTVPLVCYIFLETFYFILSIWLKNMKLSYFMFSDWNVFIKNILKNGPPKYKVKYRNMGTCFT